MADFISLSCSSCGSKLQITEKIERFSCVSCGNEYVVNRSGGIISLAPVVEGLKEVKVGVDKTASELAIKRLRQEISSLEKDLRNAKESNSDEIKNGIGMGFFGLVIGILAFVLGDSIAVYILCGGGFILSGIIFFVMAYQGLAGANQGKIDQIANKLNQKRIELRYHQDIVNKI